MTTPSKEGLKFSNEERRKAHAALWHGGHEGPCNKQHILGQEKSIDIQCRLKRAEELLLKSRPSCRNPFCWCEQSRNMDDFGHSGVCREINDFLTSLREEREP